MTRELRANSMARFPCDEATVCQDGKILVYHRDGKGPKDSSCYWLPFEQFEDGYHEPVARTEHERRLEMARNWTKDSPAVVGAPPRKTYKTHSHEVYEKIYGEDLDRVGAVEDLKDKAARKTWPGYVMYTDHNGVCREGPSPQSVDTAAKRAEYCKRYGIVEL